MSSTLSPVRPSKAIDYDLPLTKAAIAELSPTEICRLTHDDLVRVVRAGQMSFLNQDELNHLQYLDRPTLERLVYLARRTCRNQGY